RHQKRDRRGEDIDHLHRRSALHHHRFAAARHPRDLPDPCDLAALAYVVWTRYNRWDPNDRPRPAMERSFKKEVQSLTLGDGETFRGEGILAVTKALLQSGVSYVGGYQGAPVSHLLDVLVDAQDIMADL